MENYDTLSEAINDLKASGYTLDLNLKSHFLECDSKKVRLHPEDFKIDKSFRFEGMSNPDDNSILYAISSTQGLRGLLVDAYGVYAEGLSFEMNLKFKSH
jgi:hypothetical protein